MITGGCHCGTIRYQAEGEALTHALCHCTDCRRHAGAPMVGWTMYPQSAVRVTKGTPKVYASSENGRRQFCPDCGPRLWHEPESGDYLTIKAGSLDEPVDISKSIHIWTSRKLPGTVIPQGAQQFAEEPE